MTLFRSGPKMWMLRSCLFACASLLASMASADAPSATRSQADQDEVVVRAIMRMPNPDLTDYPAAKAAIARHIRRRAGQSDFIDLVRRFQPDGVDDDLKAMMLSTKDDSMSLQATRLLLAADGSVDRFAGYLREMPPADAARVAMMVGLAGNQRAIALLSDAMVQPETTYELRSACLRGLAKTNTGGSVILDLVASGELPGDLRLLAGGLLASSPDESVAARAAKMLPPPAAANATPMPPLDQLAAMTGDVTHGLELFRGVATCANCHKVDGFGKEVGPDLSEIGTKLSRESMYTSILDPSAGISHNYESYTVLTEDGRIVNGLLMADTDEKIVLRSAEAIDIELDPAEVIDRKKSKKSIMPENLHHTTDQQGLVDLVEYMTTLTKKEG